LASVKNLWNSFVGVTQKLGIHLSLKKFGWFFISSNGLCDHPFGNWLC